MEAVFSSSIFVEIRPPKFFKSFKKDKNGAFIKSEKEIVKIKMKSSGNYRFI
jgi:hypothetical protein